MLIHRIYLLRRSWAGDRHWEELLDEVHIINRGLPPGPRSGAVDVRNYEVRDVREGGRTEWVTHARSNGARALVALALRALAARRRVVRAGDIDVPDWMSRELATWAQRGCDSETLEDILAIGLEAHLATGYLPRSVSVFN